MILEISFYVFFPSVHPISVNLQMLLLTASKLRMAILWPTVILNMTSCNRLSDIRVVSSSFFLEFYAVMTSYHAFVLSRSDITHEVPFTCHDECCAACETVVRCHR